MQYADFSHLWRGAGGPDLSHSVLLEARLGYKTPCYRTDENEQNNKSAKDSHGGIVSQAYLPQVVLSTVSWFCFLTQPQISLRPKCIIKSHSLGQMAQLQHSVAWR